MDWNCPGVVGSRLFRDRDLVSSAPLRSGPGNGDRADLPFEISLLVSRQCGGGSYALDDFLPTGRGN